MHAPVTLTIRQSVPAHAWRATLRPLGFGLLLLGVVFHAEITAAVSTWNESTAYNHCFLIIPIALYLVWERRNDLAVVHPAPWPGAILLSVPAAAIWLIAERLGIMEGRQLAVISLAEVLFLAVLGQGIWRTVAGPMLYLYFLVPVGAFLTPGLQDITTFFIRCGLSVLGVPCYIDGYTIEIPQGIFFVAEACAGLRFLIASVAFGALYALLMYRSPMRRAVFMVVAVITPIIANGVRGIGIVYLGYLLDSTQAAAADHVIYGGVFFSFVILVLTVLGLPFRQDHLAARLPIRLPIDGHFTAANTAGMTVAAGAIVLIAAIGPATRAIWPPGTPPLLDLPMMQAADCTLQPVIRQGEKTQGGVNVQRIVCGSFAMELTWQAVSPRATAAALMAARRRLTSRAASESLSELWLPAPGVASAWRIMTSNDPAYVTAVSLWVNGKPVRPNLAMRASMAWSSLFGSPNASIVATLTPAVDWNALPAGHRERVRQQLETFLLTHPQLGASLETVSKLP